VYGHWLCPGPQIQTFSIEGTTAKVLAEGSSSL